MQEETNLWLAQALHDVGGVQFGDFTLGRTAVNSPVYVNPRLLISEPAIIARIARLIDREIRAGQGRRRPRISPFSLVAGVPFGGLHLATAFSLLTEVPMIYVRPTASGGRDHMIEGRYHQGQNVLVIDDLTTGGGSIVQTIALLEEAGLSVRDIIVLVDREQGAGERLRNRGYNLIPILRLKTMLTYLVETGRIDEGWYRRSMEYLERQDSRPGDGEPR